MVDQATIVHSISTFLVAHRRKHYPKHLPPHVSNTQKSRFLSSPPFNKCLFDKEIITKIKEELTEDIAVKSNIALSNWVTSNKRKRESQLA